MPRRHPIVTLFLLIGLVPSSLVHAAGTVQVVMKDDKGQPVTTNVVVMVQAPMLDAKGQPVMTNGVAVMTRVVVSEPA